MTDRELAVMERDLMGAARSARARGKTYRADRLEEAAGCIARALFGEPKAVLHIEPTEPPVPPAS